MYEELILILAVQHERGPRNSTLRRQVAMYLKETSDLRAMAAMSAPQHFFRPPMFLPGALPPGIPQPLPTPLNGTLPGSMPGSLPVGMGFDHLAAAAAVASVRSPGHLGHPGIPAPPTHHGLSPVSPPTDTTVIGHSSSPSLPTGAGTPTTSTTLHHPTPKVCHTLKVTTYICFYL